MFKFIEFLKKRPKDKTIKIMRALFGIIILALLGLNFNDFTLNLPESLKANELNVRYALFILGIIPVFMGIDICFAKRKYVRIIQIIFGIILITAGNMIEMKGIQKQEIPLTQSGSIDLSAINSDADKSEPVDVGFWIALLGILPMLGGISGKCITQKCYKHGEIITKIRV